MKTITDFIIFIAQISPLICIAVVLLYAGRLLERKDK